MLSSLALLRLIFFHFRVKTPIFKALWCKNERKTVTNLNQTTVKLISAGKNDTLPFDIVHQHMPATENKLHLVDPFDSSLCFSNTEG